MKRWIAGLLCVLFILGIQVYDTQAVSNSATDQITGGQICYGGTRYNLTESQAQEIAKLVTTSVQNTNVSSSLGWMSLSLKVDTKEIEYYEKNDPAKPISGSELKEIKELPAGVKQELLHWIRLELPENWSFQQEDLAQGGKLRIYNDQEKLYTELSKTDAQQICNQILDLSPTPVLEAPGKRLTGIDEITLHRDNLKIQCLLYENGMEICRTSDQIVYPSRFYTFSKNYSALVKQLDVLYQKGEKGPYWLGMVYPPKISSLQLYNSSGQRMYQTEDTAEILSDIESVWVRSSSAAKRVYNTAFNLRDARKVQINFSNDISYTILYTDTDFLIRSSDMAYGLLYKLENGICAWDDILAGNVQNGKSNPDTEKPVIYLYPEEKTDVHVQLNFKGDFTYTYPTYREDGWHVTAYPDGRLVNLEDGREHYYLFWEGTADGSWKCDKGSVVAGEDTEKWLIDTLSGMGLTAREYNDFITYWVPRMQENPYNLISFSEEQYDEYAPLSITPTPDSILRVHMVWKPLQEPVEVPPQTFSAFQRKGFTVVEWGGTQIP